MARERRSKYANDAKDVAQLSSALAQKPTKDEVRLKAEKLGQTDMTEEFLQQMAGATPINAVPADEIVDSKKLNTSVRSIVNKADKSITAVIDNTKFYGKLDGYNVHLATSMRFPFTSINDLVTIGETNKIELSYRIYIDKTNYNYSYTAGGGAGIYFKTHSAADIENGATILPMGVVTSTFPSKDAGTLNKVTFTNQAIPTSNYFGVRMSMATGGNKTDYFLCLVDMKINDISIMNRLSTANVAAVTPLAGETVTSGSMTIDPTYSSVYVPKQYVDPTLVSDVADNKKAVVVNENGANLANKALFSITDRTKFTGTINGYTIYGGNARFPFSSINDLLTTGATNKVELTYRIYIDKNEFDYNYQGGIIFKTHTGVDLENGTTLTGTQNGAIPNKEASVLNTVTMLNQTIPNANNFGVNFMLKSPAGAVKPTYFLSIVDIKINDVSIISRLVAASVALFFTSVGETITADTFKVLPSFSQLYVPKQYVDPSVILTNNRFKGKKLGVLGDSISTTATTTKPYHNYVVEQLQMTSSSVEAVVGSAISRDYGEVQRFTVRYLNLPTDLDLVCVFGGVNDGAPIGNFTDAPTNADNVSFYGSMHYLCQNLVDRYPNATIFFITPMPRVSNGVTYYDGWVTLSAYVDAIKKVCNYYSIPVLDFFTMSGMSPFNATFKATYMPDGLHPNDAGHVKMAEKVTRFINTL